MRPELLAAASAYRLSGPRARLRGRSGAFRGSGVGSSQEFLDFRDYAPGDDLRHLDWRSYARTDQLHVRLFQEEVAPHVDVLVDTSASLQVHESKAWALRDLVAALLFWARQGGSRPRCLMLGGGEIADVEQLPLQGNPGLSAPRLPLRPRALRVVVSDFLVADDPGPALRRLFAGAGHAVALQLLTPWELAPEPEAAVTLCDCESGARIELSLDAGAVALYQRRLQRLCNGVRSAVLGLGGVMAQVRAEAPAVMFRRDLLAADVVEPA